MNIRDADHVARCCSLRSLDKDGRPGPGAFELKNKDDGCLSVTWLEHFGKQSVADNIPPAREELCENYTIRNGGKLAVLNVGAAKRAIRLTHGIDISVRKNPRDRYLSHACIEGYPTNDVAVATTLSDMVGEDCLYEGCTTD